MGVSIFQLLIILIVIPVILIIFFLPAIVAYRGNHPHKFPILIVNIIGGLFFGLGWFIALVWCFIKPSNIDSTLSKIHKPQISGAADEIEKLYNLKDKGIISESEFENKKKEIMGV